MTARGGQTATAAIGKFPYGHASCAQWRPDRQRTTADWIAQHRAIPVFIIPVHGPTPKRDRGARVGPYWRGQLIRVAGVSAWQDIATAPKDGRVVWISHEEVGAFPMAWNPIGTNHLFAPGVKGIWEAPDASFTWKEGGEGPSRWMSLEDAEARVPADSAWQP